MNGLTQGERDVNRLTERETNEYVEREREINAL